MNWDKGYSASFYMTEVDPESWVDTERIEITDGSINRELDGLMQSASVSCVNYPKKTEKWVRIYMDVNQSGSGAHVPLFTGLAVSPEEEINGTWVGNSINCYSVLKTVDDVKLARGWYAPTDMACVDIIRELLLPAPAPIRFENELEKLNSNIVAEAGETNLTMISRILTATNWSLRILGDGTLYFGSRDREPVMTLDPLTFDVVETQIRITADWYQCPNVFMAMNDETSAIAKDEDPKSFLSIQNRGREVWMFEKDVKLSVTETMEEYASRRLKEEQAYITNASYNRRFVPDIMPGDKIIMHYPKQGINGEFTVKSQNISLGYCAQTAEEVIGVTEYER